MSPKPKPKKRAADLSGIAFERLRQAILTGELKEGDRVRESRLAAQWDIGVTPLREAVRRMAAIGYLILQPNCAEKRDAIKAGGAYPAFTLALTIKDANALLAHGWPNAKQIAAIPAGMIPVILISEERCLSVLMRRE